MELLTIQVVMENQTKDARFEAEHGLSLFIQANNYKILFDAGQSGKMVDNAQKMGIPLEEIDCLVLSHGHYDHCGGVEAFLEINRKAKIIHKKGIFAKRYNKERYIGVPFTKKSIAPREEIVSQTREILPDLFVVPDITLFDTGDTHFNNLYRQQFLWKREDRFDDELFLVIRKAGKINIITGCAHRGITNIIKTAKSEFDGYKVHGIVGGFHLSKETDAAKQKVGAIIEEVAPDLLCPMHCAGEGLANYISSSVKIIEYHTGDIFYL